MPTDFIRAPLSTSLATDMFAKQARPYSLPCLKYLQRAAELKCVSQIYTKLQYFTRCDNFHNVHSSLATRSSLLTSILYDGKSTSLGVTGVV